MKYVEKKGILEMKKTTLLEIIERIENCLEYGSVDIAKQLIKLEIENLKGITEERCKKTKYYFYDDYCKYCSNLNCNSNQNKNEEVASFER